MHTRIFQKSFWKMRRNGGGLSMELLPFETIREIHKLAVAQSIDRKRDVILASFDPSYVAHLEIANSPAAQLLLDLATMNRDPVIAGGVTPLHRWLTLAATFSRSPVAQRFFDERAAEVADAAAGEGATPGDRAGSIEDFGDLPEALVSGELLPAGFMVGATRTARSVVRLVVPQVDGELPRLNGSGDGPACSYGTAWLIGPQHLLTNWHVVEARAEGEQPATLAEVHAQCKLSIAEFDYDVLDAPPGFVRHVEALEHYHQGLDYAVLRLAEPAPADRGSLPLREAALTVTAGVPFPVNIVQHPGAAAKQFGIRNNHVVAMRGVDLAYYTDTLRGSSGSPVCDDTWRVVALHKAATMKFGKQNFQGKEVRVVNVGTPIRLIIDDLRTYAPAVWTAIAPTVV